MILFGCLSELLLISYIPIAYIKSFSVPDANSDLKTLYFTAMQTWMSSYLLSIYWESRKVKYKDKNEVKCSDRDMYTLMQASWKSSQSRLRIQWEGFLVYKMLKRIWKWLGFLREACRQVTSAPFWNIYPSWNSFIYPICIIPLIYSEFYKPGPYLAQTSLLHGV